MIEITSDQQLKNLVGTIDDCPLIVSISRLVTDEIIAAVTKHLENQLCKSMASKVESHIILTRSLFLMSKMSVYVDFTLNKVFLTTVDNKEYFIEYKRDDELYSILSTILYNSKYACDESDEYEEYRDHTRIIFDNADRYEGKSYRVLWSDVCAITDSYFTSTR